MQVDQPGHTPVLPEAVRTLLGVRAAETVVDATVGAGGHALMLAEAVGNEGTLIGLDVDPASLTRAGETLRDVACRVELRHANFAELAGVLGDLGVGGVDVLFVDLGVSSTQLDDPERGLSFRFDGPLDMRLDPRLTETAADLVNRLKERDLGDLLYFNSQEHASRRIARRICELRRERRITRTEQLVRVVAGALRVNPDSRKAKIHPATRTFLALRMAVNKERETLATLLDSAPGILNPGGRIGVIAFNSVEDKPVKLDFRRRKSDGVYRVVTKKPVVAEPEERQANPRSRSAKFRVAVRLPED